MSKYALLFLIKLYFSTLKKIKAKLSGMQIAFFKVLSRVLTYIEIEPLIRQRWGKPEPAGKIQQEFGFLIFYAGCRSNPHQQQI